MIARRLFICSALLLLANAAHGARYQRTQDGKILVWNNLRGVAQHATWSGSRDSAGYATGEGTLTWSRGEVKIATDSGKPLQEGSVVVSRYTGKMVRGKFEGLVMKEQGGTTLYTTFVNGNKASYWSAEPTTTPKTKEQKHAEPARIEPVEEEEVAEEPIPSPSATPKKEPSAVAASTVKPSPSPIASLPPVEQPWSEPVLTAPAIAIAPEKSGTPADHKREEIVRKDAVGAKPAATPDTYALELAKPPSSSSLHMTVGDASSPQALLRSTPSRPPASPPPAETATKEKTVDDLKEKTQSVLSQVGDATDNFREIDQLDSVGKLPAPVSESVVSLVDRARERRLEFGYEAAAKEYATEIQTADALSVVDQVTRNIAFNNASAASSKVADFLKSHPQPLADSQKPLWRYLTSVRTLCGRLEKEAGVHLQRAQALASAGKTEEAIQQYREANQIFPNSDTAKKIRELSSSQTKPRKP